MARQVNLKSFLVRNLRRISYKWPPRNVALREARIERGVYVCNMCGENFRNKEIVLDHIEPVINPSTGFVDWNEYVERLFVYEDGWQVLCRSCHDYKTEEENKLRLEQKRLDKENEE